MILPGILLPIFACCFTLIIVCSCGVWLLIFSVSALQCLGLICGLWSCHFLVILSCFLESRDENINAFNSLFFILNKHYMVLLLDTSTFLLSLNLHPDQARCQACSQPWLQHHMCFDARKLQRSKLHKRWIGHWKQLFSGDQDKIYQYFKTELTTYLKEKQSLKMHCLALFCCYTHGICALPLNRPFSPAKTKNSSFCKIS